jgi:hypothetical protein
MAEDNNRTPNNEHPPEETTPENTEADITTTPEEPIEPPQDSDTNNDGADEDMAGRLERLGGEPAPAISPEEFARLQQSGQIHIDARGRVRTSRREKTDAGMSLRKRRAWYHPCRAWSTTKGICCWHLVILSSKNQVSPRNDPGAAAV